MNPDNNFKNYYIKLYSRVKNFAQSYVLSECDAENIVQNVFVNMYEHWDLLDENINIISYLFTSIKNACIDFLQQELKKQKAKEEYRNQYEMELQLSYDSLDAFNVNFSDEKNIEELLDIAIQKLPERCREIFIMSKIEGRKQKEIAEKLGITVNTVETQMGVAYKKLREELKDYVPLLLFLLV